LDGKSDADWMGKELGNRGKKKKPKKTNMTLKNLDPRAGGKSIEGGGILPIKKDPGSTRLCSCPNRDKTTKMANFTRTGDERPLSGRRGKTGIIELDVVGPSGGAVSTSNTKF